MKKIYTIVFAAILALTVSCNNNQPSCKSCCETTVTDSTFVRPESKEEVLAALKDGNARFVAGNTANYHKDMDYVAALKDAQHPFACVVACSDSRVPVELLFDQGFGDLFIIRTAGNTLTDNVTEGSVEYAINHLNVNTVIVLGHTSCGAVTGVISLGHEEHGHHVEGDESVVELLEHVAQSIPQHKGTGENLEQAIQDNTDAQVAAIESFENVKNRISDGTLQIIPAIYDIETGVVEFQN